MKKEEFVDKFLAWPLPESVCSDKCVTERGYPHPRVGTNLLTADEAGQMFDYLFGKESAAFSMKFTEHDFRSRLHGRQLDWTTAYEEMARVANEKIELSDVGVAFKQAVEVLEKIADPRKRDHREPDPYTQLGCVMNMAQEWLDKYGVKNEPV